jgi:hypothetical protein
LQFSVGSDFAAGTGTVSMPAAYGAATSYTLKSTDVKALKALAVKKGVTELYYRVCGEDADAAFVAYSAAKIAACPAGP